MKLNQLISKIPAFVVLSILIFAFIQNNERNNKNNFAGGSVKLSDIASLFEEAKSFDSNEEPEIWSNVYNAKKDIIGKYIKTTPYVDHISGYAGNVPFVIGLSPDNTIKGIRLLPNNETPRFIRFLQMRGFFDSWNGYTPDEALELEVDTVTSATYTTRAVILSLKERISMLENYEGFVEAKKTGFNFYYIFLDVIAVLIIIFGLLCIKYPKLHKYRFYLLIIVVILGFLRGMFLSLYLLEGWVANGVSFFDMPVMFLLAFISVVVPLTTNKAFYCSYICPYGALQEVIGKMNKNKIHVTGKVYHYLKYLRLVILSCIILLLFIGFPFTLANIEPFSAFLVMSASLGVIIFAMIFLILSIFFSRPWCNYFCPTGQILDLFKGWTLHRKKK